MDEVIQVKPKTKRQQRALEGLCPQCGKFAYPYHYCNTCRIMQNIYRVVRQFEKLGWVDVSKIDGRKAVKWRKGADVGKLRNYSPEAVAKMSLPRLKGKPMTEKVIEGCIMKVLNENNVPMTEAEIQKGVKQLKTIGEVIPEKENLILEYKLIKQKKSNLPKSKRDAVEYRINFLLQRGVINETQISV